MQNADKDGTLDRELEASAMEQLDQDIGDLQPPRTAYPSNEKRKFIALMSRFFQ